MKSETCKRSMAAAPKLVPTEISEDQLVIPTTVELRPTTAVIPIKRMAMDSINSKSVIPASPGECRRRKDPSGTFNEDLVWASFLTQEPIIRQWYQEPCQPSKKAASEGRDKNQPQPPKKTKFLFPAAAAGHDEGLGFADFGPNLERFSPTLRKVCIAPVIGDVEVVA